MIKILLADDHVIIRAGLKIFIKNLIPLSDIEEAWDGDTTFEKIKITDFDIIILDVNMPATDSFGLVSNILALKPQSKILMFSMNAEEIYAKKYLHLGALGYINKDAAEEEIKEAINNVLNNKRYISHSLTKSLTESALGKKMNNQNPFDLLSPRELEIASHLMKGESVSEISSYLNLHTSTVGTHKARIFEKLQCKNIVGINELARVHKIIKST
jgi:two-component system, NarL family, invasion response regulator UvrY